ncbi:hypothetical protein [Sphaerotilus microaerophilus]|jgi:hypothetical protein|uniref:Uncharacterized protein n=1 Tax=Sphaerotilus microaerophilus TaxID=2914710 RepID=A0ABM7YP60_9BURK|nr:hypothetical protein [Sphaerotilus sp. FB-5]BDI06284.1 hypothetical protein CATMQ487_32540 [Sphaerotilus sp. FB-5]
MLLSQACHRGHDAFPGFADSLFPPGPDHPSDSGDAAAEAGAEPPFEWSDEEIVLLQWRLLQEIERLTDPATPLEEKLDTLRWVFTERHKEDRPFSFVRCLHVVGCSPLSPIAYCGLVDAEVLRDHIRAGLHHWLGATLQRYPLWVREAIAQRPEWVESQLLRNPQWLNEQVLQVRLQGDLFA